MNLIDIWTYHPHALAELIYDGLERDDYSLLRGIQCFSAATEWAPLQGMESLVNSLFEKSLRMGIEANEYRARLQKDGARYRKLGVYDAMDRRVQRLEAMHVPYVELQQLCYDLNRNRFLKNLEYLEKRKFVNTDFSGDWNSATVWLPKDLWGDALQNAVVQTSEQNVYSSALGTLIAYSAQNKTIRPLKAVVVALNRYPDGMMTTDNLKQAYIEQRLNQRKLINFKKRDSKKDESIRAIYHDDGRTLQFSREMVRANDLWMTRAEILLRQRLSQRF